MIRSSTICALFLHRMLLFKDIRPQCVSAEGGKTKFNIHFLSNSSMVSFAWSRSTIYCVCVREKPCNIKPYLRKLKLKFECSDASPSKKKPTVKFFKWFYFFFFYCFFFLANSPFFYFFKLIYSYTDLLLFFFFSKNSHA